MHKQTNKTQTIIIVIELDVQVLCLRPDSGRRHKTCTSSSITMKSDTYYDFRVRTSADSFSTHFVVISPIFSAYRLIRSLQRTCSALVLS